jgi:hypothetical protein
MTNVVLAFDELDSSLGNFISACQRELDVFFNSRNIVPRRINSNILNDLAISIAVAQSNPSFVFGAYSHGNAGNLLKSAREPYVSIALNGGSFGNSFFYTFSCSSGKELGRDLIGRECLCFIGYKETIAIWSTYIKPFVECANYGLTQFFEGNATDTILSQMKEKYNEQIDAIYKNDYMIASILKENRDALIMHGKAITIHDL